MTCATDCSEHVILVSPEYPAADKWGGIAAYTRLHAHALASLGAKVSVITSREVVARDAADGPVRVYGRFSGESPDSGARETDIASAVRELSREHAPLVVEAPEYRALLYGYLQSAVRCPVVTRLHGSHALLREYAGTRGSRLTRRLFLRLALPDALRKERSVAQRADGVIAPTSWATYALRSRGWKLASPLRVIPNPVASVVQSDIARRQRSIASVLFFGRLDRVKGADLFPAICERIWQLAPETPIGLLGQDTPRSNGESWVEWIVRSVHPKRRHLLSVYGGVSTNSTAEIIRRYDVAVFASAFETFSYTLAECMALGVACVVASIGGAKELGAHGTHFVGAGRNAQAIAEATQFLLERPGARLALGMAAADLVSRDFAPGRVASQALQFYREVSESRSRSERDGLDQ